MVLFFGEYINGVQEEEPVCLSCFIERKRFLFLKVSIGIVSMGFRTCDQHRRIHLGGFIHMNGNGNIAVRFHVEVKFIGCDFLSRFNGECFTAVQRHAHQGIFFKNAVFIALRAGGGEGHRLRSGDVGKAHTQL